MNTQEHYLKIITDALDTCEGMDSTTEYLRVMCAIRDEVEKRLRTAVGNIDPREALGGEPQELTLAEAADWMGTDEEAIGPAGTVVLRYLHGAYVSRLPTGEYNAVIGRDEVTGTLAECERAVFLQFPEGRAPEVQRALGFDY